MGYPMTMKRVVNRNRLAEGDYHNPGQHALRVNVDQPVAAGVSREDLEKAVFPHLVSRLKEYEGFVMLLLGDLRRLERDTVDEGEICRLIALRTGLDPDTVAAVLKEFMEV